jgi:peptide/nickel transport system substrate-binding protein
MRAATLVLIALGCACADGSGELRFCLLADPKTFDPLLATEEASEEVRYLTSGVLIRFNRQTQQLEPELATSWKILDQGRRIDFVLRRGIRFSDGSPFGAADVVATVSRMMNPDLHSAIADTFRSGNTDIRAKANGAESVSIIFSKPAAGLELLFDQLAISPARAGSSFEKAVLGPYVVTEHKSGQYVLLRRNMQYWKTDRAGKRLPYIDSIRLDIQPSRDIELLRFRRGELHFVDKLTPEAFERLSREKPAAVLNAGASLDPEFLWFNQYPNAPIPAARQRWFRSKLFRRAISSAINRNDIIRLVYHGYAHPALGPMSQANKMWFNSSLKPHPYDPDGALKLLREAGFRLDGQTLRDSSGNAVEFSVITNAGSKVRADIGSMMQQDLKKIGIRLNLTMLDFQSLVERITRTQQYEACLLGLSNVEIDPNSQMNVWISSGTHHAWNPGQAKPATAWEAEIDQNMKLQATAPTSAARKKAFDRVQEIVAEEEPIVYLVNPDVLVALAPDVRNAAPSILPPHLFWNIEHISLDESRRGSGH